MKYLLKWGIPGEQHHEEEYEAESEIDAKSEAHVRAMNLVYWSHERLDPLTTTEIDLIKSKVVSAFADLPKESQEEVLNALSRFVEKEGDRP